MPDAARGEWSDPALARVAEWLGEAAGLTFPTNRRPGVEDALRRVMEALDLRDAAALLARVQGEAAVREQALEALTIGETYFFRDPQQLALLGDRVLPALARRAGGPRPLRLWSAGCASGEEPYTLAMLVREAGWSAGASVLGTDVAAARLAAARRARYGRWSLRGVSPERLARWFRPAGRGVVVGDAVRGDVTFRALNLATGAWPSVETGTSALDVVFCRNVLIYFDRETVVEVARRLLAALAPDGWLFLGASDPPLADLVPCTVVQTGAGLLYRPPGAEGEAMPRPAAVAMPSPAPVAPPRPRQAPPRAPRAPRETPRRIPVTREATPAATAPDDAADAADAAADTARVRQLADRGQLREAGEACAAALARHPMDLGLHLLHATLLLAASRTADAAAAARRALYLDRLAPVSHLLLGDALAREGDVGGAARAFRTAAQLLADRPPDEPVAHAGGETAGSLLRVARWRADAHAGGATEAR